MPANVRISAQFPFPSGVAGTTPIAITKANGIWSVALPLDALATQNPSGGSLTTDYVLVWDSLTGTYFKMPVSNIPTGPPGPPGAAGPPGPSGGITDAPSDGVNYGRKNAAWNNLDTLYAPIAAAAPLDALAYNGMQINGSMEVSQEFGAGSPTQSGYGLDGWRIDKVGTMIVGLSQQPSAVSGLGSAVSGLGKSLYVNVATAQPSLGAGDSLTVGQLIEGYRIARLAWGTANAQPITIGFWSAHNRPGLYSGSIRNFNATRSYAFTYTHNAANIAQYNTITIPGDTGGTWKADNTAGLVLMFAVASGATTITAAGSWVAGNFTGATGQVNGVAATSDFFTLTGVVVLPGIEAPSAARSPFIMRPFDQELLTCQRYYEKSYDYATALATATMNGAIAYLQKAASATATAGNAAGFRFRYPKRAAPSVSIYSTLGVGGAMSYSPAGAVWVSIGVATTGIGETGVQGVYTSGGAGMTLGAPIETAFHYIADARL
jgi:hypothetical protein